MSGDNEIIESLHAIGYDGNLLQPGNLGEAFQHGMKSENYRELVVWLTDEMRVLGHVEEKVHIDAEINDFLLELSGFLKEIQCPYSSFTSGNISQRFQTDESRRGLIECLLSELMALKMCHNLNPPENVVIEINESPAASALKDIAIGLNLGKPPDNIAPKVLFEKINTKLDSVLSTIDKKQIGTPLYTPVKPLNAKQWQILSQFQRELESEYNLRREMLITRLDVTIQSFQWSDKLRGKEDKVAARYAIKRKEFDAMLQGGVYTGISALLAAREDLAILEKTSSARVQRNTHSSVQKHVMGRVPDRGGRAYEHAPPPPEMPSWQQRAGGGGGGARGGGRGGGRGGNWQSQPQRQQFGGQGGYQQQGGYHQQQQQQGGFHQQGQNRVQGGWSQDGNQQNNSKRLRQDVDGDTHQQGYRQDDYNRGGRGRNNYNRGGRRY